MSNRLRAASLTLFATAAAHSGLGEVVILRHMGRVQGLPSTAPVILIPSTSVPGSAALTRQTLRFTWHLPSLLGCALALILNRYADRTDLGADDRFVLRAISVSLFLCAVVVFAATRGRHPGWVAFLVAAILCWTAGD